MKHHNDQSGSAAGWLQGAMGEWIGGGSGPARRLSDRCQPQNGLCGRIDPVRITRGVRSGGEFQLGLGGGSCRCDRRRPGGQSDALKVGSNRGRLGQERQGGGLLHRLETDESLVARKAGHLAEGGPGEDHLSGRERLSLAGVSNSDRLVQQRTRDMSVLPRVFG